MINLASKSYGKSIAFCCAQAAAHLHLVVRTERKGLKKLSRKPPSTLAHDNTPSNAHQDGKVSATKFSSVHDSRVKLWPLMCQNATCLTQKCICSYTAVPWLSASRSLVIQVLSTKCPLMLLQVPSSSSPRMTTSVHQLPVRTGR